MQTFETLDNFSTAGAGATQASQESIRSQFLSESSYPAPYYFSQRIRRRYALGLLRSKYLLEKLETRLMLDDGFYAELKLLDDQLIENYLDGEFSASERRGFEERLRTDAALVAEVKFTRLLFSNFRRPPGEVLKIFVDGRPAGDPP